MHTMGNNLRLGTCSFKYFSLLLSSLCRLGGKGDLLLSYQSIISRPLNSTLLLSPLFPITLYQSLSPVQYIYAHCTKTLFSSPAILHPHPPVNPPCPLSLFLFSASNTVVVMLITTVHSWCVYSKYKKKEGNLTVPLLSLSQSRTSTWQLLSRWAWKATRSSSLITAILLVWLVALLYMFIYLLPRCHCHYFLPLFPCQWGINFSIQISTDLHSQHGFLHLFFLPICYFLLVLLFSKRVIFMKTKLFVKVLFCMLGVGQGTACFHSHVTKHTVSLFSHARCLPPVCRLFVNTV